MRADDTTEVLATRLGAKSRTQLELFEELYNELHARAKYIIRGKHRLDPTSPTSLVHEAFLRLRQCQSLDVNDEAHFVALASLAMRRVVIDRAKTIRAAKHGGGKLHESLEEHHVKLNRDPDELIAIDQALDRIAADQPRASQVAELIIFASLGIQETAALLGVSRKTVQRDIHEVATALSSLGYGKSTSPSST